MRLTVYREIPEDDRLAGQWNNLVGQMESPEVFYTYEWALAVSRAYRESIKPLLMLGYDEDALVGVAALAADAKSAEARFIAGTTADYCDFVSQPWRRSEFLELVFRELQKRGLGCLVLANLPANSASVSALPIAAHANEYSLFSRPAFQCAQIILESPGQREFARQSVQRRQMLRRHFRAMSKLAPVTVCHMKRREDIVSALPAFQNAHVARFSSSGRVSNLASPERQAFLRELACLLSGPGWITLTTLKVGDAPVAWNYGFQFSGSWFWYQPAFDTGFQRYYPGLCLLAKIVEEASQRSDIKRVDLGLGSEKYKERFATGSHQTLHLTINASRARHVKEIVRNRAVCAIKSSPSLEQCVRRLLGRASAGGA